MRIKEIEKDKCGKCPLIDVCGEPYEEPYLCREKRLQDIDVEVYRECYFEEPYQNIKKKAHQMQLEIEAPKNLAEEERDEWEEEHNCLSNIKYAFMELFLEKPITCSYEEWNR